MSRTEYRERRKLVLKGSIAAGGTGTDVAIVGTPEPWLWFPEYYSVWTNGAPTAVYIVEVAPGTQPNAILTDFSTLIDFTTSARVATSNPEPALIRRQYQLAIVWVGLAVANNAGYRMQLSEREPIQIPDPPLDTGEGLPEVFYEPTEYPKVRYELPPEMQQRFKSPHTERYFPSRARAIEESGSNGRKSS